MLEKASLETGVLRRCRDLLGGSKQLARRLRVPERDLQTWLTGKEQPTKAAFLAAVDILIEQSDPSTLEEMAGNDPDIPNVASQGRAQSDRIRKAERHGGTQTRRVLVVDDHRDTAESTARLVEEMGHQARYATDARSALSLAREFLPEVVILDMRLPDMNGADLSRLLRVAQSRPIRVVAISGSGSPRVRELAKDAGCDEFVTKPLQPGNLEELLRKTS